MVVRLFWEGGWFFNMDKLGCISPSPTIDVGMVVVVVCVCVWGGGGGGGLEAHKFHCKKACSPIIWGSSPQNTCCYTLPTPLPTW